MLEEGLQTSSERMQVLLCKRNSTYEAHSSWKMQAGPSTGKLPASDAWAEDAHMLREHSPAEVHRVLPR